MAVTSATDIPTYTPPADFPTAGKKDLDQSDFMKLFITQLQYQDPSKPMDSYQIASQLAQFSSMQATMKMSDSMDNLLAYQKSQNNLQLLSLLNNDVQALGNNMSVKDGETTSPAEFVLQTPASSCLVDIYDARGNLVRELDYGSLDSGTQPLTWDSKDYAGQPVADGMYSYQVGATDTEGNAVNVESHMGGTVTGVQFNNGQAQVTLNGEVPVQVGSIVNVVNQQQ